MESNAKVILPVTYPMITSYTHYANLLSILCNKKETEGWIYNNFINLWGTEYEDDFFIRFGPWDIRKNCPFVDTSYIDEFFIANTFKSITDYIISAIQLGYYVYINYDQFYIPLSNLYLKHHSIHHLFIYGYNKTDKEFYIADFFANGKYSYGSASFEDVQRSINCAFEDLKGNDMLCELIKPVNGSINLT